MKQTYFVQSSHDAKMANVSESREVAMTLYNRFAELGYSPILFAAHAIQAKWEFPKPKPLILPQELAKDLATMAKHSKMVEMVDDYVKVRIYGTVIIQNHQTGECETYNNLADFKAVYKIV